MTDILRTPEGDRITVLQYEIKLLEQRKMNHWQSMGSIEREFWCGHTEAKKLELFALEQFESGNIKRES